MARGTVQHFIESYDDEDFYGWAVTLDGQMIGTVGAYDYDARTGSIELGISIDPAFWGKGFASEAMERVLRYLTEDRHITQVKAWCASDNLGSKKAMEKCGMQLESVEEGALQIDGKIFDKVDYIYNKK